MRPDSPLPSSASLAAGLLAGLALAPEIRPVVPMTTALSCGLFLLALLLRVRASRPAAGLFLLAAVTLGVARSEADHSAAAARVAWLPGDGVAVELHLTGRVLGAAEADAQGDRLLRLRGRPAGEEDAAEPLTVLLRVGPSSTEATERLEALAFGDRVRVWARIRRPRSPGNPGQRDPRANLRAQGLDAFGSVKNAELVEIIERGPPGFSRGADGVRLWARKRLDGVLGTANPTRALVGAMLLGDRASLSGERQRMLRRAGLAHLVAISGLHVGLILWAVHAALGRALGLRGWARWTVSLSLLSGFALVVGGRASVWRAVLGAGAWLGGRCLGREGAALNHLLLVAAFLAWLRPWAVGGPGFQLTFLAAAGILGLSGSIREALPLPPAIGLGPTVSVAAYLATSPVVASHFGWLAPVGLLTNLLALPICACLLATGFMVLALGDLAGIGGLACGGCHWASSALWWLAEKAAAFDPGAFVVPSPGTAALWFYYALLCAVALQGSRSVLRRLSIALLGIALVWIHLGSPPARPTGRLEVRVIDVGQGLAVAVRGPAGRVALFDAGGSAGARFDPGERIVVPSLLRWSGKRVEALVLSHGDVDHAGGAVAVLEGLEVGQLLLGPTSRTSPLLRRVRETARSRGVTHVIVERGRVFRVGEIPLRILGPDRDRDGIGSNDGSVVVLAGISPHRVLLPGDLETDGEAELLASGMPLRSELLIVAHHGSRSGSSAEFLARARPDWAVASAGFNNRFGHPHPDVQRRLAIAGARLLRTDLDGAVVLRAVSSGWNGAGFRSDRRESLRESATGRE